MKMKMKIPWLLILLCGYVVSAEGPRNRTSKEHHVHKEDDVQREGGAPGRAMEKSNCGDGVFSLTPGQPHVITSPNYPNDYDRADVCVWVAKKSTTGSNIGIEFHGIFRILGGDSCSDDDYLRVQGKSFCGSKRPDTMVTSGNELIVVFKTSLSLNSKGFNATIYETIAEQPNLPIAMIKDVKLEGNSTTEITSPNYPQYYPNYLLLVYRINGRGNPEDNITVTMSDLDLDSDNDECEDFIWINDKAYCGGMYNQPDPITVSGGETAYIIFSSDESDDSLSGFKLSLTIDLAPDADTTTTTPYQTTTTTEKACTCRARSPIDDDGTSTKSLFF